ncbi:Cof-type HAD-IIB family hydrolase [Paenibacillus sp. MAH-36]|uniref:Cof-type HAD-IIB family hydrolase n=1 Tax=Paenibacillus violae TaxID=3077234 RepID=A0ABU3RD07_9BACL|nr:Cof-type HAD-IIB family hydrolase [Paenibacillus sp. PFR10]MDU0202136.1 Cof-type HAD-IIB family hydrolase [Paenibacillus sp. PFR10]
MTPTVRPYRMVVTDIDGTLVDLEQMISERNMAMIHTFQQQGGIVTLATGRMEDAVQHFAEELDIRHPVILYNGGKIVDLITGECLFEAKLTVEVVRQAIQLQQNVTLDMIFYSERKLWVKEITPIISTYMKKDRVQCLEWDSPDFLLKGNVNKILIIREEQDFTAVLDVFLPVTGIECELVHSESTYLEILPQAVSKGHALKLLVAQMGIEMQDVIAIGDNLNDLEMIREAGLGVAVDNAHPKLKVEAQYIAKSHLNHAVAEVIEKYCLQK